MSWLWGCMVLTFKVCVGSIMWLLAFGFAGLILGAIVVGIAKAMD